MKESKKLAFGGIVSALSFVFMFLTGIFPFAEYALPALAGIVFISLVIEIGKKTAYIAYIVVGLLSLFIAPNKEAVFIFIFFMGYYPILKGSIEQIKSRKLEWVVKLILFNVAVISAYLLVIYVFGMTEFLGDLSMGLKYGIFILLVLGNIAFVIYDIALSRLVAMYLQRIRPKIKTIFK